MTGPTRAIVRTLLWTSLAVIAGTSGCREPHPGAPVQLRHEAKKALVFDVTEEEHTPELVRAVAGKITSSWRLRLSCLAADEAGTGDYEATVQSLAFDGPIASGVQVDTAAKRPLSRDSTGANAVILSLLPRHSAMRISPLGQITGSRRDAEVEAQFRAWSANAPITAGPAMQRLAERADPALAVQAAFGAVSSLLPPRGEVPPKEEWTCEPPAIDTAAGPLAVTLTLRAVPLEGDTRITASGTFRVAPGAKPSESGVAFLSGEYSATLRLERDTGSIVTLEETSRIAFRTRKGEPTEWRRSLTMKRVLE